MVISFKYIFKFKGRGGGQDSAKEGRGPPGFHPKWNPAFQVKNLWIKRGQQFKEFEKCMHLAKIQVILKTHLRLKGIFSMLKSDLIDIFIEIKDTTKKLWRTALSDGRNECCVCFEMYRRDDEVNDWLQCACGRWLHEKCITDIVHEKFDRELFRPHCLL